MSRITIISVLLALTSTTALAKKFPVTTSPVVPAAQGQVDIGKDNNGNTKIKLKVEHLASPEKLTPPQSNYVLWLQERGASTPENRGRLAVNKKLEAEFEAVTPFKNFDLFVTAEADAMAKTPSGPEILRSTIQP